MEREHKEESDLVGSNLMRRHKLTGNRKCKCPACIEKRTQLRREKWEKKRDDPPSFYSGGNQNLKKCEVHDLIHTGLLNEAHKVSGVEIDRTYRVLGPRLKNGRFLYHGTRVHAVNSIAHNCLKKSTGGLFGPGVYLTPQLEKALNYCAPLWFGATQFCPVLVCRAEIKPVDVWGYKGYNVEAWGGYLCHDEVCIKDPDRVSVEYLVVFKTKKEETK